MSGIVQYAMLDTPLYGGDNPLTVPYSPALTNNVVLATKVSANATAIYAFDTKTGSCLWQDVALPTKSNSLGPVIADDRIVLAGNSSLIVYARKLLVGHVYDMAIDQISGSWVARDITRATQAPAAVGDPSGYFGQVPRVVYRSQNNHIWELSIWPPTGKWIAFDMTAYTGAPTATGDSAGYFAQVPRVVYRSQNGQIIELSIDPSTSKWIAYNMTETSTAGNPSPYLADTPHVVFSGQ